VASKFATFESSLLQSVRNIYEKVSKMLMTDLDEMKQRLRMKWSKLDHVVIAAAIRQCHSVALSIDPDR